MKALKKALGYIGGASIFIVVFGAIIILLRSAYLHPSISLITLICCPFIACYFLYGQDDLFAKKSVIEFLWVVLVLSICATACIMSDSGKPKVYVEKLFLNGHTTHHEVAMEDEDGHEYYETKYYYELDPGQPAFVVDIIEWGLIILSLGIPILIFSIIRRVSKGEHPKN